MKIAIDFDGTLVDDKHPYDDLETPLRLLPGALDALQAMKRAGHVLIVWSGRANRSIREDWRLDPIKRTGMTPQGLEFWKKNQGLNEARYQQMQDFISAELGGLIDAVDDGRQGKPGADVFIDDRALNVDTGWGRIAAALGEGMQEGDY